MTGKEVHRILIQADMRLRGWKWMSRTAGSPLQTSKWLREEARFLGEIAQFATVPRDAQVAVSLARQYSALADDASGE